MKLLTRFQMDLLLISSFFQSGKSPTTGTTWKKSPLFMEKEQWFFGRPLYCWGSTVIFEVCNWWFGSSSSLCSHRSFTISQAAKRAGAAAAKVCKEAGLGDLGMRPNERHKVKRNMSPPKKVGVLYFGIQKSLIFIGKIWVEIWYVWICHGCNGNNRCYSGGFWTDLSEVCTWGRNMSNFRLEQNFHSWVAQPPTGKYVLICTYACTY